MSAHQLEPIFFLQQTATNRDRLSPVGAACAANGVTVPGLVASYGEVHLEGVRDGIASRAPLDPLIADPGSVRYEHETSYRKNMAAWIRRAEPSSNATWDATVRQALRAQRARGADYLLVPGVELHGSQIVQLRASIDATRRAFRNRDPGDPPWLVRLCLRDEWVRRDDIRRTLLNLLSDLPEDVGVALHVRWARDGVESDPARLASLRAVVSDLVDDERLVILMKSALVGWAAAAWGVAGFSAGFPQKSWLDDVREIKIPAGRTRVRAERFFEPQLLVSVRRNEHDRLAQQTGYRACPCSFCRRLVRAGVWQPTSARSHDLYTLADLAQRVQAPTVAARRSAVRAILKKAQSDWQKFAPAAGFRGRGSHLAALLNVS